MNDIEFFELRVPDRISGTSQWTRSIFVETSPRPISIGQLHALLHFHIRPINPVVYRGPYQINLWEPSS